MQKRSFREIYFFEIHSKHRSRHRKTGSIFLIIALLALTTCPLYQHCVPSRRVSFHLQSSFFLPGGLSLISVVEVQRVYFLRARTGYLFPGATGSCTGRSCGTTVKHRRGTQDYERRSSEQRSIHRCRRYRGIRNPVGSVWNTVFNRRCIDISLYVQRCISFFLFSPMEKREFCGWTSGSDSETAIVRRFMLFQRGFQKEIMRCEGGSLLKDFL